MNRQVPRDSSGAAASTPGRVAPDAGDFAWPPTAEDLDSCGLIDLAGDGATDPGVRITVRLAEVVKPIDTIEPRRRIAALPHAARSRHWGVERPDLSFPFRVDGDEPRVETTARGETWRAAVALAAGLSLAVLSYVQFRGARGDAAALVTAVAQATTAPPTSPALEPTIEPTGEVSDDILRPSALAERLEQRAARLDADGDSSISAAPVRSRLAQLAADVIDELRPTELPVATKAAAAEPVTVMAESLAEPQPLAAAVTTDERPVIAVSTTPVAINAVRVDPVPGDEDHIRAALTRWRTAYSQLDARAARDIWPSVDARALERAFQALKSQDLRFDRCDLTVNGGSARAACSGHAVYVPRVGNQSPRAAPREWTFELKKLDEQWTIASARAS
ncbi:MAG: hypothetical protein ABIT71_20065 [Vicinamibacteraceae bacterium]